MAVSSEGEGSARDGEGTRTNLAGDAQRAPLDLQGKLEDIDLDDLYARVLELHESLELDIGIESATADQDAFLDSVERILASSTTLQMDLAERSGRAPETWSSNTSFNGSGGSGSVSMRVAASRYGHVAEDAWGIEGADLLRPERAVFPQPEEGNGRFLPRTNRIEGGGSTFPQVFVPAANEDLPDLPEDTTDSPASRRAPLRARSCSHSRSPAARSSNILRLLDMYRREHPPQPTCAPRAGPGEVSPLECNLIGPPSTKPLPPLPRSHVPLAGGA
jgi:hypothetical protein